MARELKILPRFKKDYSDSKKHPDFDSATVEWIFEMLIAETPLPEALNDHELEKRTANWAGYRECHVGADLVVVYKMVGTVVVMHRIGGHDSVFGPSRPRRQRT